MRLWDAEDAFCKIHTVCYRIIVLIKPAADKLGVQLRVARGRKIFRIYAVADDKHLNRRKNACKFPLPDIFLNLPESIHVGVLLIFQFNMDHGESVD